MIGMILIEELSDRDLLGILYTMQKEWLDCASGRKEIWNVLSFCHWMVEIELEVLSRMAYAHRN